MRFFLYYIVFYSSLALSQSALPTSFKMQSKSLEDPLLTKGLKSNAIGDIALQGDSMVWIGTGSGIAVMRTDDTTAFFNVDISDTLGSTSALAVRGNKLVAFFAKSGENISKGNGFIFSNDVAPYDKKQQLVFNYYDQSIDNLNDSISSYAGVGYIYGLPVTVEEGNVTYDSFISDEAIWTTSWAGGLRRAQLSSIAKGSSDWERVPLPYDGDQTLVTCGDKYETMSGLSLKLPVLRDFYLNPRDPWDGVSIKNNNDKLYGHHNHKAFSVVLNGNTVWVGTANGVNRGIIQNIPSKPKWNDCIDWTHYTPNLNGLSGGFVVDLAVQKYKGYNIIWAVTAIAQPGELNGISYTFDNGETWHTTLIGERGYNITTKDSLVLVSSKSGLWKTVIDDPTDTKKVWAKFRTPRQFILRDGQNKNRIYSTDEILSDAVVGVAYDTRKLRTSPVAQSNPPYMWIGTWGGLARSIDVKDNNWQIYRSSYTPKKSYVYPNPFSPYEHNQFNGNGYARIYITTTNLPSTTKLVEMDVYNFSMERVYRKDFSRVLTGSGALKWNGKDSNGRLVANGTYFIRLAYDGKIDWLKLVIIKYK